MADSVGKILSTWPGGWSLTGSLTARRQIPRGTIQTRLRWPEQPLIAASHKRATWISIRRTGNGSVQAGYEGNGHEAWDSLSNSAVWRYGREVAVKLNALEPVRARLIKKCMICSPACGEMAFTALLLDQFMLRAIAEFEH